MGKSRRNTGRPDYPAKRSDRGKRGQGPDYTLPPEVAEAVEEPAVEARTPLEATHEAFTPETLEQVREAPDTTVNRQEDYATIQHAHLEGCPPVLIGQERLAAHVAVTNAALEVARRKLAPPLQDAPAASSEAFRPPGRLPAVGVNWVLTHYDTFWEYILELRPSDGEYRRATRLRVADVRYNTIIIPASSALPFYLPINAARVICLPLFYPRHLRGLELTLDDVRQYAGRPEVYAVRPLEEE